MYNTFINMLHLWYPVCVTVIWFCTYLARVNFTTSKVIVFMGCWSVVREQAKNRLLKYGKVQQLATSVHIKESKYQWNEDSKSFTSIVGLKCKWGNLVYVRNLGLIVGKPKKQNGWAAGTLGFSWSHTNVNLKFQSHTVSKKCEF